MKMPTPDSGIIARREKIVEALKAIVPASSIIAEEEGLRAYECDGLTAYHALPLIVVLPENVDPVSYTHLTLPTIYSV